MVTLRAVRPGDIHEIEQAFARLSDESRYMRFGEHKKELNAQRLAQATHPVPGKEFTLVATVPAADGFDIVGGARYVVDQQADACEFAITVADDWKRCGLATRLMRSLLRRAKRDGFRTIEGMVLADNAPMLTLARRLRYSVLTALGDTTACIVRRSL